MSNIVIYDFIYKRFHKCSSIQFLYNSNVMLTQFSSTFKIINLAKHATVWLNLLHILSHSVDTIMTMTFCHKTESQSCKIFAIKIE